MSNWQQIPSQYLGYYNSAAQQTGVPADLLEAQDYVESGYNPNAQSSGGAEGIAQFLPSTAAEFGVTNLYDPAQEIPAQAQYDASLYGEEGNWQNALAAYNAGTGNIQAGQPYATKILNMIGGDPGMTGTSTAAAKQQNQNIGGTIFQFLGGANVEDDLIRGGLIVFGLSICLVGFIIAFWPAGKKGYQTAAPLVKGFQGYQKGKAQKKSKAEEAERESTREQLKEEAAAGERILQRQRSKESQSARVGRAASRRYKGREEREEASREATRQQYQEEAAAGERLMGRQRSRQEKSKRTGKAAYRRYASRFGRSAARKAAGREPKKANEVKSGRPGRSEAARKGAKSIAS